MELRVTDRALLIGVGEYQSLPALPTASSDTRDLAEVLADPSIGGYYVNELTEVRSAPLAEAVRGFLSAAASDDRQLIYFACHGLSRDDDYYLAASDTDLDQVHETAISLKSLLNWTGKSHARATLIILDTCNSEGLQVEPIARLSNVYASSRVAFIHSSRTQDQYSAPSGRKTIMIEALTDALGRGRADTNADGVVGIHELYSYLSTRIGSDKTSRSNSLEMFLTGPDFPVTTSLSREVAKDSTGQTSTDMGALRPYQRDAVKAIETAISSGHSKVAIEMATGTGKSAVIATLIYRFMNTNATGRVLYLTDRTVLKVQMNAVLGSMEMDDGLTVRDICPVYTGFSSLEPFASGSPNLLPAHDVYISTIQALTTLFKKQRQSLSDLFDLMIIDGISLGQTQRGPVKVWQETVSHYDAIKVFVSSTPNTMPSEGAGYLAFRYDLQRAIRDGVLVDPSTAVLRAQARAWPRFDRSDSTHGHRRVFLSHAAEDVDRARTIANQLRAAGVDAWFKDENSQAPRDLKKEILAEIKSSEVLIVLLSSAWLNSPEVREEVDAALERRGIEIVPAIIGDCAIPRKFADRGVVDVTHDIDGLLRRLQASVELDFDALNPGSFEGLIRELLTRLNFRIDEVSPAARAGHDFIATYHDAYDFADSVTYVVEAKFAKRDRPSVRSVQQLAEIVTSTAGSKRGMLVTSGYLTSVAMHSIDDINRNVNRLRVIDGPQLKSLLLLHPDLITKYFRISEGRGG